MIREVGNPNKSHKYTVQCVLPINLFNQQIFTAIWFWYLLVLFWNIAEMIVWIRRSVPAKANKWIERRVSLITQSATIGKHRLAHFIETYLEPDGIFMIRMIANNTSDFVATDLVHNLWCQHADNYDRNFLDEPHNILDVPCQFEHKETKKYQENHSRQNMNQQQDENNYLNFGHVFNQMSSQDQESMNNLGAYNRFQSLIGFHGNNTNNNQNFDFNRERNQSKIVSQLNEERNGLLDNDDSTLQHRKRESVSNAANNSTKV